MPAIQKCVLVVDDEPAVRELVQFFVRHSGHLAETAASGVEALKKIDAGRFDLVFTDLLMPGMNGDELAREIKKRHPALPIVLLTGYAPRAIPSGISLVLNKPFSREDLNRTIAALI